MFEEVLEFAEEDIQKAKGMVVNLVESIEEFMGLEAKLPPEGV